MQKSLSVLLVSILLSLALLASVINFSSRASGAGPFASGAASTRVISMVLLPLRAWRVIVTQH